MSKRTPKVTSLDDVLSHFREAARTNRDLGTSFERLFATYLVTDPQYSDRLSDVWLWSEWPDRWSVDVGIDLVARERGTGEYWAIQCKFLDPDTYLQKAEIDSFFTASGKKFSTKDGSRHFAHRLIVSTTDKWSKHAEDALANQVTPVSRLWFKDLANSPIDWAKLDLARPDQLRLVARHETRPHQDEAIDSSLAGFKSVDRGKLIMACGTGKTFTALRLAERQTPKAGRILFLAPSISLVSQTLREWTAQAQEPFHAFVVCSDSKVGNDDEDLKTHDLAYPATTDHKALAAAAKLLSKNRRTVVFSTYQSIQVVADAQKLGLGEFDLVVSDEAHRTTGLTLAGDDASEFVKVHNPALIKAKKRLYMTATPRIYGEASKTKAGEREAVLFSMDDEETFGPEFYRLGFGKAVSLDLLSEYKVLIVAVEEEAMAGLANAYNNAYKLDDKRALDIRFATKIIGAWKGLSKHGLVEVDETGDQAALQEDLQPMKRAVAFSRSIRDSKQTTEVFGQLVGLYHRMHAGEETKLVECDLDHVDGGMNALVRLNKLNWLRANPGDGSCRILSNARCLSEGIDVPALDAVAFFDTRESVVDIVQSVGRVMRKAPGKRFGYIILPVCIPSTKVAKYNDYIESDPQFKGIWRVIKALRAHDESLVDEAEFRRKITVIGDSGGKSGGQDRKNENLPLDFPVLPLDKVAEAVYAAVPKKLGDREYWSQWARDVAQIADRLVARIRSLVERPKPKKAFASFLKGLRENLNPAVSPDEAIEMLAQHIITRPVFEALFEGYSFTKNNPVSQSMQKIVELLDDHEVGSETEGLEKFYANVRDRVSLAKSEKSRQEIIRNLYDTFFGSAFPRVAERLGIVYTPIPVVDFIIRSIEVALRRHFDASISDEGVQLLDPFTGTGTFPVRLLQLGLIRPKALKRKYLSELHANEIVLLAYYIATINIESAFFAVAGEHLPFEGIVLTDTFQLNEPSQGDVEGGFSIENSSRAKKQRQQPIRVVFSNPPYSAQQDSEGDNNKNEDYPLLDERIASTYVARSKRKLFKNMYDSYVRAIRWASDRIADRGVVAFVTNGSFLKAPNLDGVRLGLVEDFSHLYVFNCRGSALGQGEIRRKEGGGIFREGSKTQVAITVLVKDPRHQGPSELHYYDIGDYLTTEQKLDAIERLGSIESVPWSRLQPNEDGDWAEQSDPKFATFLPLGDKDGSGDQVVFGVYTLGVITNRDAWVSNYSKQAVAHSVHKLLEQYRADLRKYSSAVKGLSKKEYPDVDGYITTDSTRISWTRSLKANLKRLKKLEFDEAAIVKTAYRPFAPRWLYFSRTLNEMVYQVPKLFPTPAHPNVVISSTGVADRKGYSAFAVDSIPNMHLTDTGQCFPMYWYEKVGGDDDDEEVDRQDELFSSAASKQVPDEFGYIRHDSITDWALQQFRSTYSDKKISKEDIFWYVYGVLHSTEYRQRFAIDLKKSIPRVPFAEDFWAFSATGRKLGDLHLGYESVNPFDLHEEAGRLVMEAKDYRVTKMVFAKKDGGADQSAIVFNEHLVLRGIPAQAYEYTIAGKSAIEWVMEMYQVKVDADSQIRNDPNAWFDNPRELVDLLKRVIRVSVESAKLIQSLPALAERSSP
ncbi:DEAD/DEAH box helicase [Methylibium petroleiphilum]|uniref:Adenine specific DNA methyltransferase, putative n=1 Tax=Methylibium petroleiphilum (strain ATCC BAA-1232 / LMG 22953 / PM1) TaxID=420662 RepID=A2SMU2_METPP|nr:type ISP restriction/modification enzyme [Methylibium petroleiphilum]ABM96881.1 adenine specific DNA methyltransferase, putative [Methylibium petroleiphilum PM1]